MHFRSKRNRVYKGLVAGALGGLAASWTMSRFQALIANASERSASQEGEAEDATVKVAKRVASEALHHELSPEEKKTAGPLVHYMYGTGLGALYGGLAQKRSAMTSGFGGAYGAAAWAFGDEIAVPALGLGKKPVETSLWQHVQALAAHLVYGVTLECVRRVALKAL